MGFSKDVITETRADLLTKAAALTAAAEKLGEVDPKEPPAEEKEVPKPGVLPLEPDPDPIIIPAPPPAPAPSTITTVDDSREIQLALDAAKAVTLSAIGRTFKRAVRVSRTSRVVGQGRASVITQDPERPGGSDDFAFSLIPDSNGGGGDFVLVQDLYLYRGGLQVLRLGPSTLVDKLWIYGARIGLFINAVGERARFANLDIRNCISNGMAVMSRGSYGFTASNMHISGCGAPGVHLGTDPSVANSYLVNANFRDCTIQGNQRKASVVEPACEVYIRGRIMDTSFQNVHIEAPPPAENAIDSCMVLIEGTASGTHFDEACRIHDKTPGRPAFIIGRTAGRVTYKGTITNQGNPYGIGSVRLIGGKPERWIYEGPPELRPTVELV